MASENKDRFLRIMILLCIKIALLMADDMTLVNHCILFFYNNVFYKNIEAEMCEILRIIKMIDIKN